MVGMRRTRLTEDDLTRRGVLTAGVVLHAQSATNKQAAETIYEFKDHAGRTIRGSQTYYDKERVAGTQIEVLYDPLRPERSRLLRGMSFYEPISSLDS